MKTYNVQEAAGILKCHQDSIRQMCKTGELLAFKAGRAKLKRVGRLVYHSITPPCKY